MNAIKLMRPQDWTKNLFVLIPVIFWIAARPEGAEDVSYPQVIWLTALTFASFCFAASSVYCFNDVIDAEKDRTHPVKRNRPVASGAISSGGAMVLGVVLACVGLFCGWLVGSGVLVVLAIYLGLQVLYNLKAKYVPLVDVVVIALGFVLRAAAGALAIDDRLSIWLILCVFFLCLFLGFVKRLCDRTTAELEENNDWRSPAGYDSLPELNWLLGVTTVLSIMTYLSYALSPHANSLFGSGALGIALLTPLVLIVMHRFYRRAASGRSDSPLDALVSDRVVQIGVSLYVAGVLLCLYSTAVREFLTTLLVNNSGG
jgi:decaprenyl-phosphate phosphoribosyltransferase